MDKGKMGAREIYIQLELERARVIQRAARKKLEYVRECQSEDLELFRQIDQLLIDRFRDRARKEKGKLTER